MSKHKHKILHINSKKVLTNGIHNVIFTHEGSDKNEN